MLSADDVRVRCSVRKAKNAESKMDFSEPEDMTCTMRVWHTVQSSAGFPLQKIGSSLHKKNLEPPAELLLHPIERPLSASVRNQVDELAPVQMSKRFASFGEGRSRLQMQQEEASSNSGIGKVKLSLAEIMDVERLGDVDDPTINVTTLSSGYYELTLNENGREIVMAYLKANLPKDRVREHCILRSKSEVSCFTCSSIGNKTIDVEALTSSKLAERLENETFAERLGNRVNRAFSSIIDLAECACAGCGVGGGGSTISPEPVMKTKNPKFSPSSSETKEKKPATLNKSKSKDDGIALESEPKMEMVQ